MLIMLEAAMTFGADLTLAENNLPTLDKWVKYLDRYGEDPGDQLCTDDLPVISTATSTWPPRPL